jgi:hypothetical protein
MLAGRRGAAICVCVFFNFNFYFDFDFNSDRAGFGPAAIVSAGWRPLDENGRGRR